MGAKLIEHVNGNGKSTGRIEFNGLPPWMAKMRQAAIESITEEDVKEIIMNQVMEAKQGDRDAIKFIFDQVLGGNMKDATFIQNNYAPGVPEADAPTPIRGGTQSKVDLMRRRVEQGFPATMKGDGPKVNLD